MILSRSKQHDSDTSINRQSLFHSLFYWMGWVMVHSTVILACKIMIFITAGLLAEMATIVWIYLQFTLENREFMVTTPSFFIGLLACSLIYEMEKRYGIN